MNDPPRQRWAALESGILIPVGIAFDGFYYPSDPKEVDAALAEVAFKHQIGLVPDSDDVFHDPPLAESVFRCADDLSWLSMLSRIALSMQSVSIGVAETQIWLLARLPQEAQQRYLAFANDNDLRHPYLVHLFPILFAMQIAPLFASDCGTWERDVVPPLEDAVKIGIDISTRVNASDCIDLGSLGFAAALGERALIPNPLRQSLRLFAQWHSDSPFRRQLPSDLAALIPATLSTDQLRTCPFDSAIAGAVVINAYLGTLDKAQIASGANLIVPNRLAGQNRPLRDALDSTLTLIGSPIQDFRQASALAYATDWFHQRPSLRLLERSPCVEVPLPDASGSAHLALSQSHLFDSMQSLVIENLLHSNQRQAYGDLLEEYVCWLLHRAFPFRFDRIERSPTDKRADGVIRYEDGCIVVECKSRQPSRAIRGLRYCARVDDLIVEELVQRQLLGAAEQIDETINAIIQGQLQAPGGVSMRQYASLIVIPDDIPLSVITKDAMSQISLPPHRTQHGAEIATPLIVSVDDVETIDTWRHVRLLDLLIRKSRSSSTASINLDAFGALDQTQRTRSEFLDGVLDWLKAWAPSLFKTG